MIRLLTVLIAFLLVSGAMAQSSLDLLTLSYRRGLATDIDGGGGEGIEDVAFTNMKVPIILNKDNIWYNDLTYQGSFVRFSTGIPSVRLHQFLLQTGWVHRISSEKAFQLLLVPRLMTDLQHIDSKHVQIGAIGMYEQVFNERLMMRFGLMANRDLFGPMFVPLVQVDWQLSDKLSFRGLVPIYTKLNYQVNEQLAFGLSHFGLITSFQTGDPAYAGDYFERKSIDLSLYSRYRLKGNIYAEVRGGYALGRAYRQFDADDQVDFRVAIITVGDDRTQKNTSFDSGVILDFRLVYNIPLPESE